MARDSSARARAVHLLQRISFGMRPGDVERVLTMGVDAWLDAQLQPVTRPDSAAARAVAALPVSRMTSADLGRMLVEVRQDRRRRQEAGAAPPSAVRPRAPDTATSDPAATLRRRLGEVQLTAVIRAVESERQLFEVLVDFWTNHFNVFLGKGPVRPLVKDYIDSVIRPHALGRFEDLLVATARSPAMLLYLDNASSVAPGSRPPELATMQRRIRNAEMRMRRSPRRETNVRLERARQRMERIEQQRPTGLNENYARELLELHTLGVDAGYTQQDVVNVARILTGWSVTDRARGGTRFAFRAWAHDHDPATVLGRRFDEGGMEDGLALLHFLAEHPATRRHISARLCQRFVADRPPEGCIEAGVTAWQVTDGNISEVVRAILASPDFWAAPNWDNRIKTPLEFVASGIRALDGHVGNRFGALQALRRLGQPPYGAEAPTGYPETAADWMNAGAILNRVNIGLALASGRLPGVTTDLDAVVPLGTLDDMIQAANATILGGTASRHTLEVMRERTREVPAPRDQRALIVGLALGSPEFQRR